MTTLDRSAIYGGFHIYGKKGVTEICTNVDEKTETHANLMDGMYRYQRHIYDLTRKYYLLGRDRTIRNLDVPEGGTLLEVGCGTGRNLVLAHRLFPGARLYGLDISQEMLISARKTFRHEGRGCRFSRCRRDRLHATGLRCQRLRPDPHFLCAIDDSRLGTRRRCRNRRIEPRRAAAHRRFRPAGGPAGLVQGGAEVMACKISRHASRRSARGAGSASPVITTRDCRSRRSAAAMPGGQQSSPGLHNSLETNRFFTLIC